MNIKNKKHLWVLTLILTLFIALSTMAGCRDDYANAPKETCTVAVVCYTAKTKKDEGKLKPGIAKVVPDNGVIVKEKKVVFHRGETVLDVLQQVAGKEGIQISVRGGGATAYVESINNLYEFNCGGKSGWMYQVNGKFPDIGASKYKVKGKDKIVWEYTCNGGKDVKK